MTSIGGFDRRPCGRCGEETQHASGICCLCGEPNKPRDTLRVIDPSTYVPQPRLRIQPVRLEVHVPRETPPDVDELDVVIGKSDPVPPPVFADGVKKANGAAPAVREVQMSMTKQCTKCEEVKPVTEFYKKQTHCKECMREYARSRKAKKAGEPSKPRAPSIEKIARKHTKRLKAAPPPCSCNRRAPCRADARDPRELRRGGDLARDRRAVGDRDAGGARGRHRLVAGA